ncbi:hypothetical protein QFZ48_000538 [Chitinophaga sp. W2I13]|uniref:hypothetical protein n=1 Tax=Chitinophaga sp. W2I13 TaxID=3373923 RepID=UPI003D1A6BFA
MRSWITKISLMLAVMVITAHNVMFHDHQHIISSSGHSVHDDDDDDHDHDMQHSLALNLIDHSFTSPSSSHLQHEVPVLTLAPAPDLVSLPEVICFLISKTSYQQKQEFPPPLQSLSFSALRAPPIFLA